jgi:uncharacterized protein (UPF0548 family)
MASAGEVGRSRTPRRVTAMAPHDVARWSSEPLTYAPVGATREGPLPDGFHHLRERFELGHGDAAFAHAATLLMTWQMHARAGLRVAASGDAIEPGAVVLCRLGPLPIPCRVLWVRDEPDAQGFGYGTLPGHPETGEEAFVVTRSAGVVRLEVTAYSRAGLLVTRLAGPVGRLGQRIAVRRYAAALRS